MADGEANLKRLYLVRHGQTEFNLAKLVQGRCDSPLTELGRTQALAAGSWPTMRCVPTPWELLLWGGPLRPRVCS